jgi:N-glycosylase/DNA lyase
MPLFAYLDGKVLIERTVPTPDAELLEGVAWGLPEALFTPAYWMTQYWMNRGHSLVRSYRLGSTFEEEVVACLLGGYGIPAEVGLAAFERLRDRGVISPAGTDGVVVAQHLREPLSIAGRKVTYRFWHQKATYIARALQILNERPSDQGSSQKLRDYLLHLPGIGLKTASWIVRNWLAADDVAILDVHIVRAGRLMNLYSSSDRVDKHYLKMERRFLDLATALDVPCADLDALIWYQMRQSPRLVARLLQIPVKRQLNVNSSPRSEQDRSLLA